jgi:hypothetical protein
MHAVYRFSVTLKSDDLAVIHCLRALSEYSQKSGNVRIPWGGTKQKDWERNEHQVTFHFSSLGYRKDFIEQSQRLLANHWELVRTSDSDPARPQA